MSHHATAGVGKLTASHTRRRAVNVHVVGVMLALLAVPARGLPVRLALSSPELLLSSISRLPRRSKEVVVTMARRSTSTAAPPEIIRMACAVSGNPRQGWLGLGTRGNRIRNPWSSGRAEGVVCGAVGDGNNGSDAGSKYDDDEEQQQQQQDNTGDEDDPPMLSFAAIENELQSRSPEKTTASGGGVVGGNGADEESGWLPRFFPPQLPGQDGEEDGDVIQPLVELPLDGVLLQLFPALLIGVVGLFLTIAVQVEASRFDGIVGEDGAVVVTDLRDPRTEQQQP